jgi:hypothetical protein
MLFNLFSIPITVADPEISKRGRERSQKGGPPNPPTPEIEDKSRILGLQFSVLLTLDGKFLPKRGEGGGPPGPPL